MKLTAAVKRLLPIIVCAALSACATDYVSRLANHDLAGPSVLYSEGNVDPTLLMDGTYASKQLYGPSFDAFCLTEGCSRRTPLWSSGWAP
jgi:hypothetical protein